jgi:hypothetical protein
MIEKHVFSESTRRLEDNALACGRARLLGDLKPHLSNDRQA